MLREARHSRKQARAGEQRHRQRHLHADQHGLYGMAARHLRASRGSQWAGQAVSAAENRRNQAAGDGNAHGAGQRVRHQFPIKPDFVNARQVLGERGEHTRRAAAAKPSPIAAPANSSRGIGNYRWHRGRGLVARDATSGSAGYPRGASWGEDGNIVAALNTGTVLSRVSAEGGAPQPIWWSWHWSSPS